MRLMTTPEDANNQKWRNQNSSTQIVVTLITLLLRISPGFGEYKPPDCKAQDPAFCYSPCSYIKDKCNSNRDCTLLLCSVLYPQSPPGFLEKCFDLYSECRDEFRYSKRSIVNKNIAYLLLKLHPVINQTSQYGFLTSGRFRRITGNFGTEFLGKRSNSKTSSGRENKNLPKPKPTPQFYSLPLNKFSKTKIIKRQEEIPQGFFDDRQKKLSLRGNGRVVIGSEFLGKRAYYQDERPRRLSGNEFLGKRADDVLDGSEFLGKRLAEEIRADYSGKREQDPSTGTELLGKKSNEESSTEVKRFGNELLGKKRTGNELLGKRDFGGLSFERKDPGLGFWSDYDPELIDEAFSNYETFRSPRVPTESNSCWGAQSGKCGRLKVK